MIREIGETARRANRWRTAWRVSVALLATLGSLVLAASAGAFEQRGYQYNEALSFGSQGSGAGQMLHPSGLAVNQVTGEIYVMDAGNNRIDEFTPTHEFVRAWGAGVKAGSTSKEFQVCEAAPKGTGCQMGRAGHAKGQLHGAGGIAVDSNPSSPSFGDVYVELKGYEEEIGKKELEFEYGLIQKYTGTGGFIRSIRGYKEKGESLERFEIEELHAIAVNEAGELFVYYEEELIEFNNAADNEFLRKSPEVEPRGEPGEALAVAPDKIFYVGHFEESFSEHPPRAIAKFQQAPELNEAGEPEEEEGHVVEQMVPLNEGLVPEDSSNVSVTPATQDAVVSTANSVWIFNKGGELVQKLGAGSEAGTLSNATDAVANEKSREMLATDAATGRVVVFSAEPAGPPRIEEAGAAAVTATTAQLTTTIAPGGAPTEYSFRYSPGAVPAASQPCTSPCVEVPAPPKPLGEGAEENFANVVAQPIEVVGLTPATAYHFIAIAHNANGTAESSEQTVKTRHELLGEGLPDGRGWQMVSPTAGKNGAFIPGPTFEGGLIQAAADGHAITYVASTAFAGAEGNVAPEPNQILSTRSGGTEGSQWSTSDIDTPTENALGVEVGQPSEYWYFSADLSEALAFPRASLKLTKTAMAATPYVRHNELCVPFETESCFTPVVDESNDTAEIELEGKKQKQFIGHLVITPLSLGKNPATGKSVVVFFSGVKLTTEPIGEGGSLYEWNGESLKTISNLSEGTPLKAPKVGSKNAITRNAVSPDGSLVTFESGSGPAHHLYQRDVPAGKTLQVDAPEAGAFVAGTGTYPEYQTASEDGSTIFFLDDARLTKDSTAEPGQPDLYVCEVVEEAGERACKLSDLTVAGTPGEPADVQNGVPGAANDGHNVFFVANGAMAGGAVKGNCKRELAGKFAELETLASNLCNLYVRHRTGLGQWSSPKLVATLSIEDEPDWGVAETVNLGNLTSRVSPNGEWYAFMSDRRLPTSTNPAGYNNRDALNGRPDEEVYLYNTTSEKLVCASCDPTGARPTGVHDLEQSGEGFGLLIDGPHTWLNRWLGANIPGWTLLGANSAYYQPRYLLDNGRVYFNTSQPLVPQDTNGTQQDVYQYEPAGTTGPEGEEVCNTGSGTYADSALGCIGMISSGHAVKETAFLDTSETGNDVFFDTSGQLVSSDTDSGFDVYDAAVCGKAGTESCVPPPAAIEPPCAEANGCREGGASNGVIPPGPAGTAGASAGGNSTKHEVLDSKVEKPKPKPLTRAQKYAKALKACKKIKNKHKRARCVAQAKKKYGPHTASKKRATKKAVHR